MRPTPKKEKAMRRLLIRIAFILAPYNDFLRFDERISRRAWNIRNFAYFCSSNDKSRASKQAVGGKNGGKRFSAHQFFERKTLENRRQDPLSPLRGFDKNPMIPVSSTLTGIFVFRGRTSTPPCGSSSAGNSVASPSAPDSATDRRFLFADSLHFACSDFAHGGVTLQPVNTWSI